MTAPLEYAEIPIQEKFIIMDELWENMTLQAHENGFTPQCYLDVLADREKNIQTSKSNFSDLNTAIEKLQKLA